MLVCERAAVLVRCGESVGRGERGGAAAGRFEARIGISGNKHVYLGLYNREADAAKAYDQAVVRIKGSQASTNFTLSDYNRELTEHELKQVCFATRCAGSVPLSCHIHIVLWGRRQRCASVAAGRCGPAAA